MVGSQCDKKKNICPSLGLDGIGFEIELKKKLEN